MEKMEIYREKLETQLKEWKAKIEMLEDKAARATGETKAELVRTVGDLYKKKELVKEKLNELQKISGEAWETMKDDVEKLATELKNTLDKIVSRFK